MSSFPTWDDVLSNSFCFIFWGRVKLAETANYLRIGWRAHHYGSHYANDGGFPHGFHMIFPFESNETNQRNQGQMAGKKISAISRRQNLWPMLDPWSPVILSYQNPKGVSSRGWILRVNLEGYFIL